MLRGNASKSLAVAALVAVSSGTADGIRLLNAGGVHRLRNARDVQGHTGVLPFVPIPREEKRYRGLGVAGRGCDMASMSATVGLQYPLFGERAPRALFVSSDKGRAEAFGSKTMCTYVAAKQVNLFPLKEKNMPDLYQALLLSDEKGSCEKGCAKRQYQRIQAVTGFGLDNFGEQKKLLLSTDLFSEQMVEGVQNTHAKFGLFRQPDEKASGRVSEHGVDSAAFQPLCALFKELDIDGYSAGVLPRVDGSPFPTEEFICPHALGKFLGVGEENKYKGREGELPFVPVTVGEDRWRGIGGGSGQVCNMISMSDSVGARYPLFGEYAPRALFISSDEKRAESFAKGEQSQKCTYSATEQVNLFPLKEKHMAELYHALLRHSGETEGSRQIKRIQAVTGFALENFGEQRKLLNSTELFTEQMVENLILTQNKFGLFRQPDEQGSGRVSEHGVDSAAFQPLCALFKEHDIDGYSAGVLHRVDGSAFPTEEFICPHALAKFTLKH